MLDYSHTEDIIWSYRLIDKWVFPIEFHVLAEMLSFVNNHLIVTHYYEELLGCFQLSDSTINTQPILLMVRHVLIRWPHLPIELFIIIGSWKRDLMQDLVHLSFILVDVLGGGEYNMLIRLLVKNWNHRGDPVLDQVVESYPWKPVDGYELHVVDPVAQLEPHRRILIHVSLSN